MPRGCGNAVHLYVVDASGNVNRGEPVTLGAASSASWQAAPMRQADNILVKNW
jgi:hypothetical protein